jgi:hypothetical protein
MTQLKQIKELAGIHIGRRVRFQNPEGGFIEGTLGKLTAAINEPYGTTILYEVEIDEFKTGWGSDTRIKFWVNGVDSAEVVDE